MDRCGATQCKTVRQRLQRATEPPSMISRFRLTDSFSPRLATITLCDCGTLPEAEQVLNSSPDLRGPFNESPSRSTASMSSQWRLVKSPRPSYTTFKRAFSCSDSRDMPALPQAVCCCRSLPMRTPIALRRLRCRLRQGVCFSGIFPR